MPGLFIIHTGSPVDQPAYIEDRDGNPVALDAAGTYRSTLKRLREDAVLTFETGADATLTVETAELEGAIRDYFRFRCSEDLTTDLEPGVYAADVIRLDEPKDWKIEFDVIVKQGITPR